MAKGSLWEKIRSNIREILEREGITHVEYAKKTGIVAAQLSAYLSGRNVPGIDKLPALAAGLGVTVASLLGDEEPPRPKPRDPNKDEIMAFLLGRLGLGLSENRQEIIKFALERPEPEVSAALGCIEKVALKGVN